MTFAQDLRGKLPSTLAAKLARVFRSQRLGALSYFAALPRLGRSLGSRRLPKRKQQKNSEGSFSAAFVCARSAPAAPYQGTEVRESDVRIIRRRIERVDLTCKFPPPSGGSSSLGNEDPLPCGRAFPTLKDPYPFPTLTIKKQPYKPSRLLLTKMGQGSIFMFE